MCKCGCNTCETEIRGPLLTEERVRPLVSKNLKYHLDNNIPLTENKYLSLNAYLFLIKEARKLYTRNVLDVNKKDEVLLKAQVGEFILQENKIVPLDLHLLKEEYIVTGKKGKGEAQYGEPYKTREEAEAAMEKILKSIEKAGEKPDAKFGVRKAPLEEINIGAIAGGVVAGRKKKRDREEMKQLLDMAKDMGIDISKYKLTEAIKSNMYNK